MQLLKEELDAYILVYLDDILSFPRGRWKDHIQSYQDKRCRKLREMHKLFARLHKCSFLSRRRSSIWASTFRGDGDATKPRRKYVRLWNGLDLKECQGTFRSFLGLG